MTDNGVEIASTELQQAAELVDKVSKPGVIQSYLEGMVPNLIAFAIQVAVAILIYIVGVRLISFIRKLVRKGLEKRETDTGVKQFLDALIKFSCYFILIMMILSWFGVATTSAVAVLGSAGLTIGLALQGSLSNFAGGVLILLLKPFKVGDYIIEDTHGNEGTVREISVFYTKLLTVDNKTVVIPNGNLANSSLTNVTHSDQRRIDLAVGVSYQANLKQTKAVIEKVLLNDPARMESEEINVFVSDLGDSSVVIGARVWVPTEKYWEARWRILEEIKEQLDAAGIEIPYPQMDVTIKK